PCVQGFVFTKKDCPEVPDPERTSQYRSLIALANFISCWTRPDITFTVNKLCKYMSNPGPSHWSALKHLLSLFETHAIHGPCLQIFTTNATPRITRFY